MCRGTRAIYSLVFIALLFVPAWAGSNFSGTWKLDAQKSWFGMLEGTGSLFSPEVATMSIEQAGDQVKIKLFQSGGTGDITTDLTYRTDGSECINELEGYKLTSYAEWNDDVLSIRGDLDMSPFYPQLTDQWTLTENGRKLIISRSFDSSSGGDSQKWVFDRQD